MSVFFSAVHRVVPPVLRAVWRPTVTGLEHVPETGGVLLASNHLSFVDSVVIPCVVPRPVAFLASFESEDAALKMVNSTDYGLANSVWSSDLGRCSRIAEQMRAGNSWINAHNVFPHGVPYGGIGKSGLGGGVNSPETLFDYWRSVSVVRPL